MQEVFICHGKNEKEIYDELCEDSFVYDGDIHNTILVDEIKLNKDFMETLEGKSDKEIHKLIDDYMDESQENFFNLFPEYEGMTYLYLGKSEKRKDLETGKPLNKYVFFGWYSDN